MAAAGENYKTALANTTPSSADVESLVASLAIKSKAGSKAADSSNANAQPGTGHTRGATPSTGDESIAVPAGLLAALGTVAILANRKARPAR